MATIAKVKKEKVSSKSKAKLDAKNKKQIEYRITHEKELKYVYPEETESGKNKKEILAKRKQFRASIRRGNARLVKALKVAKKGKDPIVIKKAERALNSFIKANIVLA